MASGERRPVVALVVNPGARGTAGSGIGTAIAERLRISAHVRILAGNSAAESVDLLARAVTGSDAVFVCGGDGMVHLAANVLAQGSVPLGIVPTGTGNDIAAVLGIPADPLQAVDSLLAAVLAGSIRRVDLGLADSAAVVTGAPGRWWVSILCAGFDSAVNERANLMRWPRGRRRYDIAIAMELLRLRPIPMRTVMDGATRQRLVTLLAVCNGPSYGGGKVMAPGALMDDGQFDVTEVGPVSRFTLARLAPTLSRAGHIGHPAVTQYRARSVTLSAPRVICYADGERLGALPITTRCVPAALPVLVPR